MKKILIANDLLKGGGVENVLENMVCYLLKQDKEITLMIPGCTKKDAQDFLGKKIKLYPTMRTLMKVKRYSLSWFLDRGLFVIQKQLYRIRFFLKQYDVIIALKEGPIMKEIAGLYAKKRIAWIHVDFNFMHWTEGCFNSDEDERKCMIKFDKVVCVSKASADSVIQTIGDPGNLCVRYNPMNYIEIIEKSNEFCPEKKSTDGFLFVSVGRLAYPKNYSLLIDVCSELSKNYDFELWIVGDGADRTEIQKKIDIFQLKNIKILGNQNNPYSFLKMADAFVSTSICESYGLAIQEALILGVPVVTVECPAIKEVFDTRYGIMVDNSFSDLYNAMEKMILHPELLDEYKKNIEHYYKTEELYEKRLQDICNLWEQ